jgi:hypothetical protein
MKSKNNTENTPGSDRQERLVRLSWRKAVGRWNQPTTYSLFRGSGPWLAVVQSMKDGTWFWYGGGRNTSAAPTDLKTAKKEAKAHVLSLANATTMASEAKEGQPSCLDTFDPITP